SSRVSRPSGGSSEAGTVASPESGVDPAEALLEVSGGFGPRPIPRGSPPVSRIHATTSRRKTPPPIRIHRRHPRGSGRDADILRLEVLLDPLEAALAAEAGVLDPAEGGRRVGHDALVDPDHPELEGLAHPQGAGAVLGEGIGDEPVLAGVG